jgi:thiol-disulfide isomerase/thioredoxin
MKPIIFILFLFSFAQAQITPQQAYQNGMMLKSVSYNCVSLFKSLHKDTSIRVFQTYLIRENGIQTFSFDSTYNIACWRMRNGSSDTILYHNSESNSYTLYHSRQKKFFKNYLRNYLSSFGFEPFLGSKPFEIYYINDLNQKYLGIVNYHGYTCLLYESKNRNTNRQIYIHEQDGIIIGFNETYFLDGDFQYRERYLKSYSSASFQFLPYRPTQEAVRMILETGSNVKETTKDPQLQRKDFEIWLSENQLLPDSLRNKYVLVYLWHLGCYPCMKGLPSLMELQNQISRSDFLVFGINTIDSQQIIETYFRKKNIKMITTAKAHGQQIPNPPCGVYPQILVMNPNFEAEYYEIGYHPSYKARYVKTIKKLLNK